MISLVALAVLVAAIIGALEFTHRRRSGATHPERALRDDRDRQRLQQDLAAREPSAPRKARPQPRGTVHFQPVRSVAAKASRAV